MDLHPVNILSICTGIGGLDLGVGLALPGARTVCMVEGEAPACEILASKMDEGSLHPAPIWTNARTFDGRAWAGRVHGIVAGYPCQPFSVAGKRRGAEDPRHLWPEILRIAGEVGPEFLFLENVAGHVRLGLDRVLGDLAEVGFDTEWATFRASDVGAPHRRERVFILAYAERNERWSDKQRWCSIERAASGGRGATLADAERGTDERRRGAGVLHGSSGQVKGARDQREWRGHSLDRRVQANAWPPGPDGDWSGIPEDLWPATQPTLRGVADGVPGRVDRLRALGNAVVPAQAALAFQELARRIG